MPFSAGRRLYIPTGGLPTIYFSGTDEPIKVVQYDPTSGALRDPMSHANDVITNGSISVVSSNGGTGGVLWVASRGGSNASRQLFAYDLDPSLGLGNPKALLATMPAVVPYSPEAVDPACHCYRQEPLQPEFGCTTCHRRQGAATTVEEAHNATSGLGSRAKRYASSKRPCPTSVT